MYAFERFLASSLSYARSYVEVELTGPSRPADSGRSRGYGAVWGTLDVSGNLLQLQPRSSCSRGLQLDLR